MQNKTFIFSVLIAFAGLLVGAIFASWSFGAIMNVFAMTALKEPVIEPIAYDLMKTEAIAEIDKVLTDDKAPLDMKKLDDWYAVVNKEAEKCGSFEFKDYKEGDDIIGRLNDLIKSGKCSEYDR